MPRENEDEDWENPDESDMDDSADAADVEPCPYCKKPIHEQAEWCHHCGKYISTEDAPPGKGFWWTVTVVGLLTMAMLIWRFG